MGGVPKPKSPPFMVLGCRLCGFRGVAPTNSFPNPSQVVRLAHAGESQRQPATAYAAFVRSCHAEPAHQGKHGEQRYLAPAWPTNAVRDPRRGAATEMGRGEHATAMRETYRERLVALSHRARSPTAPSAPKLDHALGRPHHRRARGFSAASRRTPREAARTMAPRPQAYADGPWAGGHPVGILPCR